MTSSSGSGLDPSLSWEWLLVFGGSLVCDELGGVLLDDVVMGTARPVRLNHFSSASRGKMVDMQWLQILKIIALCNEMNSTQGKLNNALYSSRFFVNVALPTE